MSSRSKLSLLFIAAALVAAMTLIIDPFHQPSAKHPHPGFSENITALRAWELLRDNQILIIDIRRPSEWRQTGSPRGALRLSFEEHPHGTEGFLRDLNQALHDDKTRPFAIICRTGNRTAQLLHFLHAKGFSGAMAIPEGMVGSSHGKGWLRNNLPVDR